MITRAPLSFNAKPFSQAEQKRSPLKLTSVPKFTGSYFVADGADDNAMLYLPQIRALGDQTVQNPNEARQFDSFSINDDRDLVIVTGPEARDLQRADVAFDRHRRQGTLEQGIDLLYALHLQLRDASKNLNRIES